MMTSVLFLVLLIRAGSDAAKVVSTAAPCSAPQRRPPEAEAGPAPEAEAGAEAEAETDVRRRPTLGDDRKYVRT